MALPEVLDILSTAAFDNPESIPNQNCALLRQLEIWRCDNDSYEIINEPLLINSLPLWLSQPVPESFESNKVVAGTKFLIVELAHETVYGLNGHSAIQSALEAFELPSALRSCYDFGGSYSHIQLPIRLGVDNHKCFYCRFPGQIGITWSKNGNTLLSRGVAVFWDHKCANLFVDYMMMHKAWVGMVLLPAYICSLVYLHDMIQNTRHIALEIQAVEGKTRFNRFSAGQKYVDIHPKTDDHVGLCTFTSGTIARLLFARHKAKEFHKILGAIKKGLRELVSAGGGLKPHSEWTRLQRTVDDIDELCESLIDQIDMHRSLGENQVNAIFNTMSYSQGRVTTVIARDIKGLSMGSGVDLIAMLSLFFLPGTFIASFLAMPIFDWNTVTGHQLIMGRFWLYWKVALPLTFLIISAWWVWSRLQRFQLEGQKNKILHDFDDRLKEDSRTFYTGEEHEIRHGMRRHRFLQFSYLKSLFRSFWRVLVPFQDMRSH